MQKLVWLKTKNKAYRDACRAAGTCPELTPPPSITGTIYPCIDGKIFSMYYYT